jgi:hypothetical protein
LAFSLFALWSQLTPLGSAPDEAAHYIKSAAVVRGELVGERVKGWYLSLDGWAYDAQSGIAEVIILAQGEVVHRSKPTVIRDDVATMLGASMGTPLGFSIWVIEDSLREPYSAVVKLRGGDLVPLRLAPEKNVLMPPQNSEMIDGVRIRSTPLETSLVEDSHFNGRMEFSHWSTFVDIDPQFAGANAVQRCFVAQATQPGCGLRLEDQVVDSAQPITAMGRYASSAYIIPGIGTLLGPNNESWYVARFLCALASAFVLALTVVSLRLQRRSLLPLFAALFPAVVFLSSVVNPSGLEIVSAITVWISAPCVLATRTHERWHLLAFVVGSLGLILARPLGMVYFAVIVIICIIANGSLTDSLRHLLGHRVSTAIIGIALSFASYWYLFVYSTHIDSRRAEYLAPDVPLSEQVIHSFGDAFRVLVEAIGDLGSLEVPVPRLVFLTLLLIVAWLVTSSWSTLTRPTQVALISLIIIILLFIVATNLNYYRIIRSYGVQGRHLTPFLVGIPLLVSRQRRFSRATSTLVIVIWCVAQFLAAYTALRRYSVGLIRDEVWEMFYFPRWTPPLGIIGTLLVLTLLLSCSAFVVLRSSVLHTGYHDDGGVLSRAH